MIATIGAGHSGLYASLLFSKKGENVKIYEQKKEIGVPVHCTGILTSKINELMPLPKQVIKNKIQKIEVHSKNNSVSFNLRSPDIILDRKKFEQYLAEKAESAGAKIFLEKKFIGKEGKNIVIKGLEKNRIEKIRPDYIIGADGPLSQVYSLINPKIKREYYKGIQVRVKGNFEKNTFKVYLGSLCPNFFAWIVPESEEIARIGLASAGNQNVIFGKFLNLICIKKENIIETQAGLIPLHNPRIKTQKDNIFLLGDAASQIKSTTGGGIIQGIIAANCLCNSITKNISYEYEWRKKLGKELWLHLKIRKFLDNFSDKDYDVLISMLKKSNIKEVLETESRDSPSRIVSQLLLLQPQLIGLCAGVLVKSTIKKF
jgi:digeranylgeranylglycerophospholipid reductase